MKAEEFYQSFTTLINNDKHHAEELYKKSSLYTLYIKEIIGEILSNCLLYTSGTIPRSDKERKTSVCITLRTVLLRK